MLSGCRSAGLNPSSLPIAPETVVVPAGPFIKGSSEQERAFAYQLDETAYGHALTRERQWYAREFARDRAVTGEFSVTVAPITNAQYQQFVDATAYRPPDVSEQEWQSFGFIHPYPRTRRFAWRDGEYPEGRGGHPVVLVSIADARRYAAWLSQITGMAWRLPTEAEWEKAVRGLEGNRFPWGDEFDPGYLNSHDAGPFDTEPVGLYPQGASPFGVLDGAGQVFEWTATTAGDRHVVKGGSWDDKGCGVCRPAARHTRPSEVKHILIGFRLVHSN